MAWSYAKPHAHLLLLSLLLSTLVSWLYVASAKLTKELIDDAIPNKNLSYVVLLSVAAVAAKVLVRISRAWRFALASRFEQQTCRSLSVALYAHLQRLGIRFFAKAQLADLEDRLEDVRSIDSLFNEGIVKVFSQVTQQLTGLMLVFGMAPKITLLLIFVWMIVSGAGFLIEGPPGESRSRKRSAARNKVYTWVQETLSYPGAYITRVFGLQDFNIAEYARRLTATCSEDLQHTEMIKDMTPRGATVALLTESWEIFAPFLLALGVIRGTMTGFLVGEMQLYKCYLHVIKSPLEGLYSQYLQIHESLNQFEATFKTLQIPVEIANPADGIELSTVGIDGVRFENVSFLYGHNDKSFCFSLPERESLFDSGPGRETASGKEIHTHSHMTQGDSIALQSVSLHIPRGTTCAIVGHSGAGKSTFVSLLLRLYDPTSGRILIDGHDLRDIKLKSLSALVTIVPQDCNLIDDTIRANLLLARPTASDAQIRDALQKAQLADMVAELKEGLDTIVGPLGVRLSGGEKQRLAIARAILRDPSILILDEATSSLDSVNEQKIQLALQPLMAQRTCFVIAHRLATVKRADMIVVLDKGRVVESGTHDQLMRIENGHYVKLYNTQLLKETHLVSD